MEYTPNQEKLKLWTEHVKKASIYNGSLKQYCRQENISSSTLSYWRDKLGKGISKSSQTSKFIPVVVAPSSRLDQKGPQQILPNPKWVAEIILHVYGGLK
ncbi:MAG: IS66 family insertion sequence element accessory protein TnpA [Pseudobdellovibrionaceae bacterium]